MDILDFVDRSGTIQTSPLVEGVRLYISQIVDPQTANGNAMDSVLVQRVMCVMLTWGPRHPTSNCG